MLASYRKDTTEWFEMHHKDAARILGSLHSSTLIVSG
jgi:hypothetical protein